LGLERSPPRLRRLTTMAALRQRSPPADLVRWCLTTPLLRRLGSLSPATIRRHRPIQRTGARIDRTGSQSKKDRMRAHNTDKRTRPRPRLFRKTDIEVVAAAACSLDVLG